MLRRARGWIFGVFRKRRGDRTDAAVRASHVLQPERAPRRLEPRRRGGGPKRTQARVGCGRVGKRHARCRRHRVGKLAHAQSRARARASKVELHRHGTTKAEVACCEFGKHVRGAAAVFLRLAQQHRLFSARHGERRRGRLRFAFVREHHVPARVRRRLRRGRTDGVRADMERYVRRVSRVVQLGGAVHTRGEFVHQLEPCWFLRARRGKRGDGTNERRRARGWQRPYA
mmetsp:Transcript_8515/g.31864  ORF Transcript_8515/g.31864 Transcript_8515/m.31864 type:complete len:229 (-) Transcript_8515:3238-3924(-)